MIIQENQHETTGNANLAMLNNV